MDCFTATATTYHEVDGAIRECVGSSVRRGCGPLLSSSVVITRCARRLAMAALRQRGDLPLSSGRDCSFRTVRSASRC